VLQRALQAGVIDSAEAELLRKAEALRDEVIQVDSFARGHFTVSALDKSGKSHSQAA